MNKRVSDPVIYRDIITIVTRYCNTQTWCRLKKSCKLFNRVLIAPPIEFKPLIRRLLYKIDEAYRNGTLKYIPIDDRKQFYLEQQVDRLKYCKVSFYFTAFMVDSKGGDVYYSKKLMGNIFTDPVEQIIINVKEAL